MAASYQTGISSSPTNLLQTLVTWLSNQGWTINLSAADGAGWRAHLLKSGSLHLNFRAAMNERIWTKFVGGGFHDLGNGGYGIGFYLGTGWSAGAPWDAQPGGPRRPFDTTIVGCGMNLPSGSVAAYHFFDDGNDHITVVVERSPGIFCHMGWGPSMQRASLPEDFPYFFASSSARLNTAEAGDVSVRRGFDLTSYPPMSHTDEDTSATSGSLLTHATAFVFVDIASWSDRWISDCKSENDSYGWTGRRMRDALNKCLAAQGGMEEDEYPNYQYLWDDGSGGPGERTLQSAFAGALLLPLHCFLETDPGDRWAPVGYPPTVFWTEAVGNGFAAGEIYQVGGLDYMLFPFFAVRKAA